MPSSSKSRVLLTLGATAAYLSLICVCTHLPGGLSPSGGHSDKLAHFGAYLGLSILLCGSLLCFMRAGPLLYAAAVGLAACYGVVDELTQLLVSSRTADPLDWVADVCGAISGALIFAATMRLFGPRETAQGATG